MTDAPKPKKCRVTVTLDVVYVPHPVAIKHPTPPDTAMAEFTKMLLAKKAEESGLVIELSANPQTKRPKPIGILMVTGVAPDKP